MGSMGLTVRACGVHRDPWVMFVLLVELYVAAVTPFTITFVQPSVTVRVLDFAAVVVFLVDLVIKLTRSRTNVFGEPVPRGWRAAKVRAGGSVLPAQCWPSLVA